ncbi:predicted protein [Plenodomus lingam JN3]|uniref:Predicted protein n=1 Tax=Leptosphaeria maculans (strain JN3 / isolate v23.1.3 / race Av1-4-5-6-7-8) TaxID=985895 RepID=E4ZUL7_LEPMJ|nr:predicted protein [Plenodomus lingam JN3]CBX95096.1 predicted protein [Plenodomus lingam JN3]
MVRTLARIVLAVFSVQLYSTLYPRRLISTANQTTADLSLDEPTPVQRAPDGPTPTPTCTLKIFEFPPVQTECTFYENTVTATSYTECHGCAIQTVVLGLGLPCRKIDYLPGDTTTTVTQCSTTPLPSGGNVEMPWK